MNRQHVALQFELQLPKIGGLHIVKRLTNYRYLLRDEVQEQERKSIALTTSFDFYELRLHRGKWQADMLIVERHNAVVPCAVLELSTGIEYRAGRVPDIARKTARKRRNHEESMLFVSELLVGIHGANQELEGMKPRTRQYYEGLVKQYLRPRVGRPMAS